SPSVYSGIANTESLSGMNLRKEGNTIIVTGAKGKELTIYDVSGRLIRCETIDSAKYSMSLDKMKTGIYIMKIDSIAKKIRVEL
ncbi:MAG: T9SS C-terminal target domain-containing protein, partial [Prevotella sp.]|nr:T9SS C-terminal target domain-containing protein [Prevotella sp.]